MALFWRIQAGFWMAAVPVIAVSDLGYASDVYSNYNAVGVLHEELRMSNSLMS